jgi:hypothetical protein
MSTHLMVLTDTLLHLLMALHPHILQRNLIILPKKEILTLVTMAKEHLKAITSSLSIWAKPETKMTCPGNTRSLMS